MNKRPEKVLVLGDGVAAFLSVIRSLGRQGIDVHVAWCAADCPALRSRYVRRFHQLPFCDTEGTWADRLAEVLAAECYDFVLPTNEQSMRALRVQRDRFESLARIELLDERTFDVVFDKVRSGQLAESQGIRVPKTRLVAEPAGLLDLEAEFSYPIVLKPTSSYDARSPLARRDVCKAYNRDELMHHGQRMLREGALAAQENFVGRGVGVELLVDRGEVLLAFQHERVHEPLRGGASSYRKSVPLDPRLLDAAKRYVAAIEYSGVIMIEFLVSRAGNDWRFVEANGRFWGSLPLAIAAGADFPYFLYQYRVHGQRQFPQHYRVNLYCRDLVGDARWMVRNLRADRRDPTLATESPWRVLLEARHFLTGRERFDTLTLDDPLPAIAEPLKYVRRLVHKIGRRARQAAVSLPPIRARETSEARAALARARSVVFLCWGNICRSPFAAAYARRAWPARVQVHSSGLHQQQGRRSPPEALEAARRFDVELEEHRSSILTEQQIDGADMIVCFDELIRGELLARHPGARTKTFRFGMLSRRGPVVVADPFGHKLPAYCAAYELIRQAIDDSSLLFDNESPATDRQSRDREAAALAPEEQA